MFVHINPFNEGAGPEKHEESRTRELREGKNPRNTNHVWQNCGCKAHSNDRWQKLRK